jgi:ketosteroid isomerase-like protein
MTQLSPLSDDTPSITGTIATFYELYENADFDAWAALWAEDGVYLNPFADDPFPERRVAGRDRVVQTLSAMRRSIDDLHFLHVNVEPALVPEAPSIVAYVSGDVRYKVPGVREVQKSHFLHRLEVGDGHVTGWIDYTNPLTRSAPASRVADEIVSETTAPLADAAGVPAGSGGDGRAEPEAVEVDVAA